MFIRDFPKTKKKKKKGKHGKKKNGRYIPRKY